MLDFMYQRYSNGYRLLQLRLGQAGRLAYAMGAHACPGMCGLALRAVSRVCISTLQHIVLYDDHFMTASRLMMKALEDGCPAKL